MFLLPVFFLIKLLLLFADVASSVPADVDVDFLMGDIICDDIAGSSSSVVDNVMNKTASSSKIEEIVCDEVQDKPISGYRLFHMDILKKLDFFPCLSRMFTDYVRFCRTIQHEKRFSIICVNSL